MPTEFKKFVIIALVVVFWPIFSSAQSINIPFAFSNELNVDINPTYPRPNEQVSLNLSLYTDDLDSATITWYQDGKSVLSGKGEKQYSFTMGPAGEETNIEIFINLLSGASFSKSFVLVPASVDIVWEAESYVPPFYQGKALHPYQGLLKLVAMPNFVKNGQRVAASNLIYKWTSGLNVLQNESGYGKDVVLLSGRSLGQNEEIRVLVTDPTNNLVAQNVLYLKPVTPEIVFYENNPYYGTIFNKAVSRSFNLEREEVEILAAPFYFTKEASGLLKYEWRLNGQNIPDLAGSRTAVFRKPEGQTGQSNISLQMENLNHILQQTDASLSVIFKN